MPVRSFSECLPRAPPRPPPLPCRSKTTADEMVSRPFDTKSDSFYFADDKLIMHNKSEYAYDAELA